MCDSGDSGGGCSGFDYHGSDSCQDLSQEHELSFTDAQRGLYFFATARPLTVMPSDMSMAVHDEPRASNSVLRAYANAVEIAALHWHGGQAWLMAAAVVLLLMAATTALTPIALASEGHLMGAILFSLFPGAFFLGACIFLRRALWGPAEYPVHFNRVTRMVHVVPIKRLSFFRFWERPSHSPIRSYPWESVRARMYRSSRLSDRDASGAMTRLGMFCLSEDRVTVETIVELGPRDARAWAGREQLWEHIRSFMEEGGAAVRTPDDMRKSIPERVPVFSAEIVEAAGDLVMDVQPAAKRRARGSGGAARRMRQVDQDRSD